MYRKPSKNREEAQARRLRAMKAGRERAAMAREARGRQPDLPELRRIVQITDFDTGTPITNKIEYFRTDRTDCYRTVANGTPWLPRVGWSRTLELLRKAYQRVPGKRSTFWW